jgi:hypothetical protein
MIKDLFARSIVFAFLLISLPNIGCKKETKDKFCIVQRTDYMTINNEEGKIVFSNKYNRYALSFSITTPNNIDSQVIGFLCDLSPELKTIGLDVISSGTLKNFNADENMSPEMGGQELYFFETTQITKK